MKKIGDVTSTADKNGEWTNGNVAAGIAPTILEAGWLNSVQREILGVIIAAGMQQDKNDDTQLSKAISKIISGGDYATKTEVNSKLAKDQNGADIPNKPKFIENIGLPELFADAKRFAVHSTFSAMYSPNGTYRACMLNDGSFMVINGGAEGSPSTFSFAANGEMSTGTVPVSRLTGLSSSMGSSTTAVMNQKGVTDAVNSTLGYKQTPHDMTSSRKAGIRYINGLPSPIYVSATFNAGSSPVRIAFLVDGERMDEASQAGSDHGVTVGAIVPPGSSYMASDLTSGAKLIRFMELK